MNDSRLYKILEAPYTTEKNVKLADKYNQVVFKVALNATKKEIKTAVERLFKVVVNKVNIVKKTGLIKRNRKTRSKLPDIKKAYISLASGHDIDVSEFK